MASHAKCMHVHMLLHINAINTSQLHREENVDSWKLMVCFA